MNALPVSSLVQNYEDNDESTTTEPTTTELTTTELTTTSSSPTNNTWWLEMEASLLGKINYLEVN